MLRVVLVDESAEAIAALDAGRAGGIACTFAMVAFGAGGANEALGERIRFRRSHWCLDDPNALASEHGVEVAGEFAVAVADQEAKRCSLFLDGPGELARLVGNPWPGRVGGDAGEVDASAFELDEEEHVQPLERDRFDGEEVDRELKASRARARDARRSKHSRRAVCALPAGVGA